MKNFFLLLLLVLAYIYAQNVEDTSASAAIDEMGMESASLTDVVTKNHSRKVDVSDDISAYLLWPKCKSPWDD